MAYFSACTPLFRAYSTNSQTETTLDSKYYAIGKLIQVDVAPTFKEGTLYGDDDVAENKKVFNYADITLNTTHLPIAAAKAMFGLTGTGKVADYEKSAESKYGKFGYVYGEVVDGVTQYVVDFFPRVKFDIPSTSFKTEGENIEFGTPSITGRAYFGTVGSSSSAKTVWRETDATQTSLANAISMLNSLIGGTLGTADDGGGEVIPDGDEGPEGSLEET